MDLIDREKALDKACGWCACSTNEMAAALKDKELLEKCRAECAIAKALNDAPAVDAVPVVRCKDCKNYIVDGIKGYCCMGKGDNWYCADGERKVGEQDADEHG